MPSGAKKRKAAKKKKEIQSNDQTNPSSAPTHSQGDDVKHQDAKESDVGEVSSPASQDHQNLLTDGEEEETKKEEKEDNVIRVEREFKIEGYGKIEHDEPARKSYDGGSSDSSSSSGSSSSDDESHGNKNSSAAADITPIVDAVKAVDSFAETPDVTIDSATVKGESVSVVESPVVEKVSLLGEKVELNTSSSGDNHVGSYEVESVSKENVEKKVSSIGEEVGISASLVDAAPERKEGTIIQAVENVSEISDLKECVVRENDDRSSHNAPSGSVDNGAEHQKDAGVTQPLLPVAQHRVETASWKSCCGLFELFTGSAT